MLQGHSLSWSNWQLISRSSLCFPPWNVRFLNTIWFTECYFHPASSYSSGSRFDVEYPIECDDEYWETDDPEQAFQQPAGKPCSITGFVCLIKLCEILGFVLRTLYSNKKSRLLSGFIGNDWEGRMVAALDSAMNEWKDALPDYCMWIILFFTPVSLTRRYQYIGTLTDQILFSFTSQ